MSMIIRLVVLTILCSNFSFAQKKETLYILFDKNVTGDFMDSNKDAVSFYLKPSIDASYFMFYKAKHQKKKVSFKKVMKRLITKAQANQKTYAYVDKMATKFEVESGLEGNVFRYPPYDFNSYFDKIFIYEKLDNHSGVLYEVDWIYAIE